MPKGYDRALYILPIDQAAAEIPGRSREFVNLFQGRHSSATRTPG
jgi:hypothetical protein